MLVSGALTAATVRRKELSRFVRGLEPTFLARYAWSLSTNLPKIIKTRSLLSVNEALRDAYMVFRLDDKEFLLKEWMVHGVREMLCRQVYTSFEGMKVRPGDICVDLGSNIGLFTLMATKMGAQKVVSVEAQSEFVCLLKASLTRNEHIDKVTALHGLIGASRGLFASREALEQATHHKEEPTEISVGDVVALCGGHVDFMKIDIEGSEFALFTDDLSWLDGVQRIAMEVHPSYGDPSELVRTLQSRGFFTLTTAASLVPLKDASHADYLFASRTKQAWAQPSVL